MRKSHSVFLRFLGMLFVLAGLLAYFRGAGLWVVLPTSLIGVVFFVTILYDIESWKHFLLLLGPWIMIILSLTSFVSIVFLPVLIVSTWFMYYPAIAILYVIARYPKKVSKIIFEKYSEKNISWVKTRLAALDTIFITGAAVLCFAAVISFSSHSIGIGFLRDWREFYIYGAAMITYVSVQRTKFSIETMGWMRAMSMWFGMVAGVFLLFRSLAKFALLASMGLNSFLFEAFLGISIIFITMKADDSPIKNIVG